MVRPTYLALAALLIFACAVSAAPVAESDSSVDSSPEFPASRQATEEEEVHNSSADSSGEKDDDEEETEDSHKVADETNEDDDDDDEEDDDDDDDSLIRRRREAETTEEPVEETATETPAEADKDQKVDATTTAAPVRKPVLVLIRDALKKVTTDLPTAQVANNALQYFQQFEHFIQQAIEEVIGDDDDEDETPVTVIPGAESESVPEEIKKPETELPEKSPEAEVSASTPEKESEPAKTEDQMASTSALPSNVV